MWTRLRLWFTALVRRTRFERELADELAFHVRARAEEWERRGLSPAAARRRARIELGSVERIKEEVRHIRLGAWTELLRQDLRYGFRVLRAHPGIATVGIASLAVGMGVCTFFFWRWASHRSPAASSLRRPSGPARSRWSSSANASGDADSMPIRMRWGAHCGSTAGA